MSRGGKGTPRLRRARWAREAFDRRVRWRCCLLRAGAAGFGGQAGGRAAEAERRCGAGRGGRRGEVGRAAGPCKAQNGRGAAEDRPCSESSRAQRPGGG